LVASAQMSRSPCACSISAPMLGSTNHATFRHYQENVAIWPSTVHGGRAACFFILAFIASGPTSGSAFRLRKLSAFARAASEIPIWEDGLLPSQGFSSEVAALTPFGSLVGSAQDPGATAEDIGDAVEKSKEEVIARTQSKAKSVGKSGAEEIEGRPLMNNINKMRAEMCWLRPNLWDHQECLKFLAVTCALGSTGEGMCGRFAKKLAKECQREKDKKLRKKFCKMSKALKVVMGEDDDEDTSKDEGNKDTDGDGVADAEDKFPNDPKEWGDLDGDGIGDNADEDKDGDGVNNDKDEYPEDPKRYGKDTDGDGTPDKYDAFPKDPKEWSDTDGDGIGDNSDKDRDGDGIKNSDDKYPDDPKRSGQKDSDGDGIADINDAFPDDPKEWRDLDKDGIGDNSDEDKDGDGYPNDKDDLPEHKTEWKDTDGDGVGDNIDFKPEDPNCSEDPCPKNGKGGKKGLLKNLNKELKPMPEQGFDEVSPGKEVTHDDGNTMTGDWRAEWPRKQESERDTILRICEENPSNSWCKIYRKHNHFRR